MRGEGPWIWVRGRAGARGPGPSPDRPGWESEVWVPPGHPGGEWGSAWGGPVSSPNSSDASRSPGPALAATAGPQHAASTGLTRKAPPILPRLDHDLPFGAQVSFHPGSSVSPRLLLTSCFSVRSAPVSVAAAQSPHFPKMGPPNSVWISEGPGLVRGLLGSDWKPRSGPDAACRQDCIPDLLPWSARRGRHTLAISGPGTCSHIVPVSSQRSSWGN